MSSTSSTWIGLRAGLSLSRADSPDEEDPEPLDELLDLEPDRDPEPELDPDPDPLELDLEPEPDPDPELDPEPDELPLPLLELKEFLSLKFCL